jgi:glycosyltransferase involved in cell wall biosynthesis
MYRVQCIPTVSIGMPIFNSEATLKSAIESLLGQSFVEFELIISDNNSSDATSAICREYANKDARIKYIKQPVNIGSYMNFKYVYDQGRGRYFLWAAGDDVRSKNFLEENIKFLESNPDYIASTSPNCFENQNFGRNGLVDFDVVGTLEDRYLKFFANCWQSHGVFYSVFRRDILEGCDILGQSFIAADWAIDLYLLKHGSMHRTEKGLTIFGAKGVSNGVNRWSSFRNISFERMVPFYALSGHVRKMIKDLPLRAKYKIMSKVWGLNLTAFYFIIYEALFQIYRRHFKRQITHGQKE